MAEEDIPAGEALGVVHTVVDTVDRTTEAAAAATTDGTAPAIGTVAETTRMETPVRPGTIRIGTRGKITARVVEALTNVTTRIRTHVTVVLRTGSAHGRTIPLREVVVIMAQVVAAQEITIAGTAADRVAVEAHPAGIMTVAAHPTINVAMIIIRRRRSEVAAAAPAVIGSIIAAAVGDAAEALAETDPGNRWDRRGRSLHAAPLAGDHR